MNIVNLSHAGSTLGVWKPDVSEDTLSHEAAHISTSILIFRHPATGEFLGLNHLEAELTPLHVDALRDLDLGTVTCVEAQLFEVHPTEVLLWGYQHFIAAQPIAARYGFRPEPKEMQAPPPTTPTAQHLRRGLTDLGGLYVELRWQGRRGEKESDTVHAHAVLDLGDRPLTLHLTDGDSTLRFEVPLTDKLKAQHYERVLLELVPQFPWFSFRLDRTGQGAPPLTYHQDWLVGFGSFDAGSFVELMPEALPDLITQTSEIMQSVQGWLDEDERYLRRLQEGAFEAAKFGKDMPEALWRRRISEGGDYPDGVATEADEPSEPAQPETPLEPDRFRVKDGRVVTLQALRLRRTYAGQLEGTQESATRWQRRDPKKKARQRFDLPRSHPILVIDDGGAALPEYEWLVQLHSCAGITTKHHETESRLAVCFFSDSLVSDWLVQLERVLERVNWDKHAQECAIADM